VAQLRARVVMIRGLFTDLGYIWLTRLRRTGSSAALMHGRKINNNNGLEMVAGDGTEAKRRSLALFASHLTASRAARQAVRWKR